MSQEPEARGAASWRQRHPILSRSLLYGVGAALVAVLVFRLVERGEVDHQDRLDYLAARLETLDVLAATDHTGDEVEKVLDEVFAEPDLSDALRQRALRARSILHLKRSEAAAALADLEAAAERVTLPTDREAIRLERVQVLITDQCADEARTALDDLGPSAHPALAIWRALLRARALDTLERRDEAIRALDDGLQALPRPLPDAEPVLFSLTPWTPAEAALHATQSLADLAPVPLGPAAWERLMELAPRDLLAAVAAAKALQRGGHEEEAARAWAWAVSLNAGRAPQNAASDPELALLEEKRVEGLKTGSGGSR